MINIELFSQGRAAELAVRDAKEDVGNEKIVLYNELGRDYNEIV